VAGRDEDQSAQPHLLLEPGQLCRQGHQAGGQHRLRGSRSSGQQPGLEGEQVADEEVVLAEPHGEGGDREAAVADAVEKRGSGGGPPFRDVSLKELGGGHLSIVQAVPIAGAASSRR